MVRKEIEVVSDIMASKCVLILNGKKFGTLLGELLKMLSVAKDERDSAQVQLAGAQWELTLVRAELDTRTPEGLRGAQRERIETATNRVEHKLLDQLAVPPDER